MIVTDHHSETTLLGDGTQECLTATDFRSAMKRRPKTEAGIPGSLQPMIGVIAGVCDDLGVLGSCLDLDTLYSQWANGEFLPPSFFDSRTDL